MSYILDAIKKAEAQRRLGLVPEWPLRAAPPRRRAAQGVALVLVLSLVGLVGAGWWLRPAWVDDAVAASVGYIKSHIDHWSAGRSAVLPHDRAVAPPTNAPDARLAAAPLAELQAMQISLVSYSRDPNKRFIMTGTQVFKPGDAMQGYVVVEITRHGVLLRKHGREYRLSF